MSGPISELILDIRELHRATMTAGKARHPLVCNVCEDRWPCRTIQLCNKYDPEIHYYHKEDLES